MATVATVKDAAGQILLPGDSVVHVSRCGSTVHIDVRKIESITADGRCQLVPWHRYASLSSLGAPRKGPPCLPSNLVRLCACNT